VVRRSAFLIALCVGVLLTAAPAVAASSWLPPFPLTAEGTEEPAVAVAVAPDGTTVAAWARLSGGGLVVEAARRRPGGTFGPVLPLGAGRMPQVGIDGAGNATVAWEAATAPVGVAAARLPAAAAAFEATQTLSSPGVRASRPAIGVGSGGTAVVLFEEGPNGAIALRAAIRDAAGGSFGGAQTVSDLTTALSPAGTSAAAAVGVAPDGRAVAVWSIQDGSGRYRVQTNERPAGLAFAATGTPRSDPGANAAATEPAVAMDAAGRAVAAWTEDADVTAPGPPAVKAMATPFGAAGTAATAASPAISPDLAALPGGSVVGTWVHGDDGSRRVQAALAPAGSAAFAGPAFLSPAAPGTTYPAVAAGADGDAIVAWQGFDDRAVHAARLPSGATAFEPAVAVASAAGAPAGSDLFFIGPQLGLDDQGNATAVWAADDVRAAAHHYRVQGAGFDAAAPALTAVTVPATATAGTPAAMSAAASDRWGPVTLRWAFGDGATATGGAVAHAFGASGPFDVGVTATDAAGNVTGAVRRVTVSAPHVAPPPPPPPRVARVQLRWRVRGKRIKLERMRLTGMPAGAEAELRCKGRRCPIRRTRIFTPSRRGAIDVVKPLDLDQRRFRAGQRLDLRISAPGHVGQVLRFNLKRGREPKALLRCMPIGSAAIRRSC